MSIRKASFAGSWYPQSKKELNLIFEKELKSLSHRTVKETQVAVLPHAGLYYSSRGLTHLILNAPPLVEEVLIIAPSHYYPLKNNEMVFGSFDLYETPLATLDSLKTEFADQRAIITRAVEQEHAIEMILLVIAYLQNRQNSPIKVASALLNSVTDSDVLKTICEQVNSVVTNKNSLIIASSDFTHYGRNFNHTPFGTTVDKTVLQRVRESDLRIGSLLKEGSTNKLLEALNSRDYTICGLAGATVLSALAKQNSFEGEVVDYYTSVEKSKSYSNDFVAYLSLLWG
ncbi:MAG: AmmeMemoRadiSam system protein B [Sphaerochaetaceae bacterium]